MYDKVNDNYGADIKPVRPIILEEFASKLKGRTYILITGTKGKTSTATYIYRLLLQYSSSVGLFTSPHVSSFCERIQLGGQLISQADYNKYITKANKFLIDKGLEYHFFLELYIAAMFYFLDKDCKYFVIEIGMGGKYDFTNIVTANYAIFTAMGLDHQKYLGNYLWQIIYQKAHIAKKDTLFINTPYHSLYTKICFFIFQCLMMHSKPLIKLSKIKNLKSDQPIFVQKNYQLALAFVQKILPKFNFNSIDLQIDGRLQYFQNGSKTLLIDGAHNDLAIDELLTNIDKSKKWLVFFNMTVDRNPLPILQKLSSISYKFIIYSVDKVDLRNESLLSLASQLHVPIELYQENVWKDGNNFLATGSFRHLEAVKKDFMSLTNNLKY